MNTFVDRVLAVVLPSVPEEIPYDAYRLGGKLRVILVGSLFFWVLLTLLYFNNFEDHEDFDGVIAGAFRRMELFNVPLLLTSIVLGFVSWKGKFSAGVQRKIVYVCVTAEILSSIANIWLFGATNHYGLFFLPAQILIYRAFYDFKIGIFSLALTLGLLTSVIALENAGVIPEHPGLRDEYFGMTFTSMQRWIRHGFTSIMIVATFLTVNWTVIRLRHKELALGKLKQALFAQNGLQQGRLTGNLLGDRFELLEVIGRGGMGEIYRARDADGTGEFAVKVLHPHMVDDEQVLIRFQREAEAAGKIPGKVAPTVFHSQMDPSLSEVFMVIEYLRGEDLDSHFKRLRTLSLGAAIHLVEQIADLIDTAHSAGIVHRDLKPANIFLESQVHGTIRVRILDFGISKLMETESDLTHTGVILGTPGFMAPEQILGNASKVGPATDIFALGAIAYRAMTGERPYGARKIIAAINEILHSDPLPPSSHVAGIGHHIDRVILKAMARDPEDRYPTAADFARDLKKASLEVVNSTSNESEQTEIDA